MTLLKSLLPIILISLVSQTAEAITCATSKEIKKLSTAEAIDLAYQSGPQEGNYGLEVDVTYGLLFVGKDDPGNRDIFNLYPELNTTIATEMNEEHYQTKHHYSGVFKPIYFQNRECRRQIMITGTQDKGKTRSFTGWINVEICSPGARKLFASAEEHYEKNDEDMDSLEKFFAYADNAPGVPASVLTELHHNLDINGREGIHYFTKSNGHIAPRFSVKIDEMSFKLKNKGKTCHMFVKSSTAYAALLKEENHYFSEKNQSDAFEHSEAELAEYQSIIDKDKGAIVFDNENVKIGRFYQDSFEYYASYFDLDTIQVVRTKSKVNRTLNNK